MGMPGGELSREESLALLGTASAGRIVYTRHALPAMRLVRFVLDGNDVLIKLSQQLLPAVEGHVVAFEADGIDRAGQEVWSVVVTGRAEVATQPRPLDNLIASTEARPPSTESTCLVRIRTDIVSGQRALPP